MVAEHSAVSRIKMAESRIVRAKDARVCESVGVHAKGNGVPAQPVNWKIPLWLGFQKVSPAG